MSTATEAAPLNPQSPVKTGEWFEVTSYIGDAQHPMVGKRIKAGSIGDHYVFPSLDTPEEDLSCFRFSEVRRVEPTERERGLENYLLEDGNE